MKKYAVDKMESSAIVNDKRKVLSKRASNPMLDRPDNNNKVKTVAKLKIT